MQYTILELPGPSPRLTLSAASNPSPSPRQPHTLRAPREPRTAFPGVVPSILGKASDYPSFVFLMGKDVHGPVGNGRGPRVTQ